MNSEEMIQRIEELKSVKQELLEQIRKSIVGQDQVVEKVLIGLFANGHMLVEGVPGLAKTLLISTIAKALNLSFGRIQFTPDLMPSDITGSDILVSQSGGEGREFQYIKGPIFANIILADEINRTPPKTQAALLQAMQVATQNPIEQEGTYPLPEAQLDRFMIYIAIDYPSYAEELKIVQTTTGALSGVPRALLSATEIIAYQTAIRSMPLSDHVLEYAVKLARSTRPSDPSIKPQIKKWINWGAGPRASQYLVLAAKARAALDGRVTPAEEDVRAVALPVLTHRVLVSFAAEAEGVRPEDIIARILE